MKPSKAVLARGAELQSIIEELDEIQAPIYGPAVRAKGHKGYIGLVYEDECIQRFSVDDGYTYIDRYQFIRMFKGKQLACL